MISDDISHLEQIYSEEQAQKELKHTVFLERILIVLMVDLIANYQLKKNLQSVKQVL